MEGRCNLIDWLYYFAITCWSLPHSPWASLNWYQSDQIRAQECVTTVMCDAVSQEWVTSSWALMMVLTPWHYPDSGAMSGTTWWCPHILEAFLPNITQIWDSSGRYILVAAISPGMDWILRYRREMVSAHQSFSCVGFYAGPGPGSSFIKTIDIKH